MHGSPAMAMPPTAAAASAMTMPHPAGHGHQNPMQHHLLAPCVSDSARLHGLALALLPVAAPANTVPGHASTSQATVSRAREHWPPDLQKLCISRT